MLFGDQGHQRHNVDGFICIHYVAPLYLVRSEPFTSFRFANFGWVSFAVCNAWQLNRTQNVRRVGVISVIFWSLCGPKFTKFWENVGNPQYFPTSLPDCPCHVLFRRYLPLSLEVVENGTNVELFGPHFLEGMTRLFCGRLLARFTFHLLTKFCWVSFADLCMRSLYSIESECRVYVGWVRMTVQF